MTKNTTLGTQAVQFFDLVYFLIRILQKMLKNEQVNNTKTQEVFDERNEK